MEAYYAKLRWCSVVECADSGVKREHNKSALKEKVFNKAIEYTGKKRLYLANRLTEGKRERRLGHNPYNTCIVPFTWSITYEL